MQIISNETYHPFRGQNIFEIKCTFFGRKENTVRVFARNLLRGSSRKNIFIFSFWCLTWGLNSGVMSYRSTHYLLDYGDFLFQRLVICNRNLISYFVLNLENIMKNHYKNEPLLLLLNLGCVDFATINYFGLSLNFFWKERRTLCFIKIFWNKFCIHIMKSSWSRR